jgi:hypothetical protein
MIAALDVTMQPVSPCNKPVDNLLCALCRVIMEDTEWYSAVCVYPARTVLVCKFTFCLES